MAACLTEPLLRAFVEQTLGEAERAAVFRHIDECSGCRVLLARAAKGESALVAPLSLTSVEGALGEPDPSDLVDMPLCPGQDLGPYRIVRGLGGGGMGLVYEAMQRDLGRRVAIKVLRSAADVRGESAQRLRNEALAANRVTHPGLVQIHERGVLASGMPYLVMEYLDGESLAQRLKRGPLGPESARQLGIQLAATLTVLHRAGIVHRDVKPANIMLVADPVAPAGERTKLLDLGLAKLPVTSSQDAMTRSGQLLGTLSYMAPEQLVDANQVTGAADVYALGAVLGECLSGRRLGAAPPQLPRAWRALLTQMQQRDPGLRPPMAEVERELLQLRPARRPLALRLRGATAMDPLRRWRGVATSLALLTSGTLLLYGSGRSTGGCRRWMSLMTPRGMVCHAGRFTMGSGPAEVEAAQRFCRTQPRDQCPDVTQREQPVREVNLSPYVLDRHEVSNGRFAAWLERRRAALRQDPADKDWILLDGKRVVNLYPSYAPAFGIRLDPRGDFVASADLAERPVTQVSHAGARAFCADQGMALPTEAQWEFAARGPEQRRFPWGDDEPRCDGVVLARDAGQGCARAPLRTEAVSLRTQDVTPAGVYHLAGNVAEWILDRYEPRYRTCAGVCLDPVVAPAGDESADRVVRGGDLLMSFASARGAERSRGRPDKSVTNVGFRCAGVPRGLWR